MRKKDEVQECLQTIKQDTTINKAYSAGYVNQKVFERIHQNSHLEKRGVLTVFPMIYGIMTYHPRTHSQNPPFSYYLSCIPLLSNLSFLQMLQKWSRRLAP